MSGRKRKIALFGHFGGGNFGNESTLWATLDHFRGAMPGAEFYCICTVPEAVEVAYNIRAFPSREVSWEGIKNFLSH